MGTKLITKPTGFTIVELLIVIAVIAILAVITVVAFNGVQERARTSSVLSSVDAYEKALRMYKTDNSTYPFNGGGTITGSAVLGQNSETRIPACLGTDYPAAGVFQEGECVVQTSVISHDSLTSTQRLVFTSSTSVHALLSPVFLNKLPSAPTSTMTYSYPIQVLIEHNGQIVTIQGTTKIASRGLLYNVFNDQASISYSLPGDQACGRGQKEVMDAEAYAAFGLTLEPAPNGEKLWTSCTITL